METDINPDPGVKPPPLTSNKLNYLVWRYLQEAGYGEAAVKLQRDWNLDPEKLSFSEHIKGQALVSLVQKGLRYHHLSLTIDENGRPSKQLTPGMFFFGPEDTSNPATNLEVQEPTLPPAQTQPDDDVNNTHQIQHGSDLETTSHDASLQSAPKRGRKTPASHAGDRNGLTPRKTLAAGPLSQAVHAMEIEQTNGQDSLPDEGDSKDMHVPEPDEHIDDPHGRLSDDRMDVDAEWEPVNPINELPIEILPPVYTLTNGESRAVQVAPAAVYNLAASTSILMTGSDQRISKLIWSPTDWQTLVASGDHYCARWELDSERTTTTDPKPELREVFETQDESSIVSSVAWSDNGATLAIATYSHNSGQLHQFDGKAFNPLAVLPASQRPITVLQWQQAGKRLIGLTPYADAGANEIHSSAILCWDMGNGQDSPASFSVTIPDVMLDIDCASHGDETLICAVGVGVAYHCQVSENISSPSKWVADGKEDVHWTFVRCSWDDNDQASVVAASADPPCIWLPTKNALKTDIHNGSITGLQLRPGATRHEAISCEFATASLDGNIKIWQCNESTARVDLILKLTMGNNNPVMSLAYSPDATCLAGASYDLVRIWNSGYGHHQMAGWKGSNPEWRGTNLKEDDMISVGGASSLNGENGPPTADHYLTWDGNSQKLAFGLGNQVAILDFPR